MDNGNDKKIDHDHEMARKPKTIMTLSMTITIKKQKLNKQKKTKQIRNK